MPYRVVKRKGKKPWKIINIDRNVLVGSSRTKSDAEASIRARMMGEFGRKG